MSDPTPDKNPVLFIVTIPPQCTLKRAEKKLAIDSDDFVVRLTVPLSDLRHFLGDKTAAELVARMRPALDDPRKLPVLITVDEATDILRLDNPKAVYTRVSRGQVKGVCRHGRRLLFRRDEFLDGALEGDG